MFIQKRIIKGVEYKYLDHSFRLGNKIKKVSLILEPGRKEQNEEIIRKIASARAEHILQKGKAYFTTEEVVQIETEKAWYQLFYNALNEKSKQEILDEFIRLFLANSMELEGSTITPQLAENLERGKRIVLPESEVLLYNNSKKVFRSLLHTPFKSVIQFSHFHKEIYQGIFADAGDFKKIPNTFGYIDRAKTTAPEQVKAELKKVQKNYREQARYSFLRPLHFHLEYQKIHPFRDGNSRLGRILLAVQMYRLQYPPLIFRGDLNFQIRETLIEYINNNAFDFYRFSFEQYLKTCNQFWRPMIEKYMLFQ